MLRWLKDVFANERPRASLTAADLARDEELYREVATFLDSDPVEVRAWGASEPWDLGFGALLHGATRSAASANAVLSWIAFEGRPAWMRMKIAWSYGGRPEQLAGMKRVLGDRFGISEENDVRQAELERTFPDVEASLTAARAKALGPAPIVDVPEDLRAAYASLTKLGGSAMLGDVVGYAAQPVEGSRELRAIAAARRKDLLLGVLRGPIPEARVNAACTLVAMGDLDDDTKQTIRVVRDLPIRLTVAMGCTLMHQTGKELIPTVS